MAQPPVINALLKKRADLLGSILKAESQVADLKASLRALDGAIWLFDPDVDLDVRPRILRDPQAKRGDVSRVILAFIRDASEPVSLAQITERVMTERGLDIANKRLCALQAKAISKQLRAYREKGILSSDGSIGQKMYWRVAHAARCQ